MVFNTGAALLDGIVLAVVSREAEGTYGYKITQDVRKAIDISESTPRMYGVCWRYPNQRCIRCCGDSRRKTAWKRMIWRLMEETGDIIS